MDTLSRSRALFSSAWYRVAALEPRIRMHARIHRQRYRGRTWYVLEDRVGERFYRFSPAAYLLIGLMDGTRTVQSVWEVACERLGDDAPTQDEVIHLLAQLHAADVLQCAITPDAEELLARSRAQRRRRLFNRLPGIISWRLPLLDPDALLSRMAPVVRPFAGALGAIVWLACVVPAVVILFMHWPDFTDRIVDRVMALPTLVTLWLLFPVIKALHELGHASLTKAYGGEVHDMGVMVLVFTPVPYVDASAAWAFPDKWRRIAVGAAGMLVELFIAALAVLVWVSAEPGMVRTVAFGIIVTIGISTVLFNGNPLLRFDGYYMLSDWLEIPNLWPRARRYLGYVWERYAFGRRDAEAPVATAGEKVWFVLYATSSVGYRILLVLTIFLVLAQRWLPLAVVFGVVAAAMWIAVPAGKAVAYVFASPRLRGRRGRALTVTGVAAAAAVYLVAVLPVPDRTRGEGVIWIPESAFVRALTEGFVDRVVTPPGARARRGDVLLVLRDPATLSRVAELEGRRRELHARYDEQRPVDLAKALVIQEEIAFVERGLDEARRRVRDLRVVAGADGTFVVPLTPGRTPAAPCPCSSDLEGRFVKSGELVGYVLELSTVTVRAVIQQEQIDLIREGTLDVRVRLAERVRRPLPASIARIVPAATDELPTTALGTEGGGKVAVDPRDVRGVRALGHVFQVDLELPTASGLLNVGGRAYVRFDHGRRPLAAQWYREIRQLFLARLSV